MQEVIVSPPRTIMEVFKMLPEGTLAEVIDKTLYMSPTPITAHQRIVRKLSTEIDSYLTDKSIGELFLLLSMYFWIQTQTQFNPTCLLC